MWKRSLSSIGLIIYKTKQTFNMHQTLLTCLQHFRLALNDSSPCSISKFEGEEPILIFVDRHHSPLYQVAYAALKVYQVLLATVDFEIIKICIMCVKVCMLMSSEDILI